MVAKGDSSLDLYHILVGPVGVRKKKTDGGALTLFHVNGVDGMLFEVAKGELVVRTRMGDSGSGSNLNEKGRTTVWPGDVVVVLDLMRLCRLNPCEYLRILH